MHHLCETRRWQHHAVGMLVRVDGKMVGAKYRTIMEENLLEAAKDLILVRRFTVQQDNGPKSHQESVARLSNFSL